MVSYIYAEGLRKNTKKIHPKKISEIRKS
jgi:hypothetical protein